MVTTSSRIYRKYRFPKSITCAGAGTIGAKRLRTHVRWRTELVNGQGPEPQGQPGYIRIDTVHQGDYKGRKKGVYHINAVDEVTQWEIVALSVENRRV